MNKKENMINEIYGMNRFDCLESIKEELGYDKLEDLTINELEKVKLEVTYLINEKKEDFEVNDQEERNGWDDISGYYGENLRQIKNKN